jgi:protein-S-isoprenylcysteine O-methyltransferase Ste14
MRTAIVPIAIPLAVVSVFFFVPVLRHEPWTPLRMAGAIIAVVGYGFVVTARLQLGKSFAVTPQAKGLVTHGLYSRICNPMYVFVDVTVFGLIFAVREPWLLLLLVLWAIAQTRQAGRESKVLYEKFGQTYLDYRNRTWF